MNSSFVVIDIEGEILKDVGKVLQHHRYKIKVLNLLHPDHSHHYDPLHYCKSKYDIERLADCIINNTSVPSGSSDFDDETEKLLLCSCISHFVEEKQKNKEENFGTLCKTICEAAGSNEKREALYAILDSSPKSSNTHKYLEAFKICALWQGKVAFFDCLARLKQFLIKDYEELFSADELELEKIGKEKTALFVLTNQPEASTSKTLPSILYTQLFDTLYRISEERKVAQGYGFNLPIHMFMNNFGIVGRISDLPMRLKTCHTYNISISLVLPNILELRNIYKKDWRPIIDNCSIWNYFGGSDQETQEIMSDKLGYVLQTSKFFKNRHVTYPFMSPQEIDILPCDKCIVSALGLKPVLDYKFDYKNILNIYRRRKQTLILLLIIEHFSTDDLVKTTGSTGGFDWRAAWSYVVCNR